MIIWYLLFSGIQQITEEDTKKYIYKQYLMNNYIYTTIYTPNITYGI